MEETLGQRIRRLRKFARMTQQTLADHAGVSHSQISGIETDDRKSGPSSSQIMPLAIALGVSADYLLSGIAPLQAVPDRSAGQGDELAILTSDMAPTSFMMVGQPPKRPRGVAPTAWIVQIVPLVQQYIHAGGGRPDDPESLPVAVPRNGHYLCMRVTGECMLPDIEPGDIVVLDQEMAVMPDWIVALRLDGETRLTRMIRRDPDEWQFMPDNPEFQGLTVPVNGVEVVGVAIARQKGSGVRRSPRLLALPG